MKLTDDGSPLHDRFQDYISINLTDLLEDFTSELRSFEKKKIQDEEDEYYEKLMKLEEEENLLKGSEPLPQN